MMKKSFCLMTIVVFALLGLGTLNVTAQNHSSIIKKEIKKGNIKKAIGLVDEATTMHFLQIRTISSSSSKMTFEIDDATNCRNSNIIIGNVVEVWYKVKNGKNIAVRILGNADYVNALGQWTMPDPINKNKRMGVNLEIEGKASSINMATLPYTSWELMGPKGKLLLHGKSIGNGQTFEVTDTVYIFKGKKGWMMKNISNNMLYHKTK